jgi:GTP cyclohydrolase I
MTNTVSQTNANEFSSKSRDIIQNENIKAISACEH